MTVLKHWKHNLVRLPLVFLIRAPIMMLCVGLYTLGGKAEAFAQWASPCLPALKHDWEK